MRAILYLIHFDEPFQHARHYLGFVDTTTRDPAMALETRLNYHRTGKGSKLLRAVTRAGISWGVVRLWSDGTRTHERRLKGHSSTRLCPACSGEAAYVRGLDRSVVQLGHAATVEPSGGLADPIGCPEDPETLILS